jgi:hypothetical protein
LRRRLKLIPAQAGGEDGLGRRVALVIAIAWRTSSFLSFVLSKVNNLPV